MNAKEKLERKREEYRNKWKEYDKWVNYEFHWWKDEDKPRLADFSGTGKEYKWPTVNPTGKTTLPFMGNDKLKKAISNTWRTTYFMQWHVLQEELGKEKAEELVNYMWLAMMGGMERFFDVELKGQERDCVMMSRLWQADCQWEMYDYNVVEESPEKAVIQQLCPYCADWMHKWRGKGLDMRTGQCDLGCLVWAEEMVYRLNPNISVKLTKLMSEGDPYCEWVFEMKK